MMRTSVVKKSRLRSNSLCDGVVVHLGGENATRDDYVPF